MIEYLRLAFGTACVLLPGWAIARALGQRSMSATLAWALACMFAVWAVVFTVHSNIRLAALLLVLIAAAALLAPRFRRVPRARTEWRAKAPVWIVGVVLGWFLWHLVQAIVGDGLFHEGRVRKLVALGDLHLRTVDEFKDGGLHPGYAFPLWHGLLALLSWFSGLDPEQVVRDAPALLAAVACAVAYESGAAVFGSRFAGWSVLLAQLALICFGPGHGGSYAVLTLPATASRQLMVPAAIALFFGARDRFGLAALAVLFGALALSHPTYALFLLIPLLAVAAWEWRGWLAAAVPTGLALLWLRPLVNETQSHDPGPAERARAIAHYGDQLVVSSPHHFRLAAEVFGRSGAVAVAALVLLPAAALAIRKRWGQFVLGGFLLVLALLLVPWLFVHFSDAVSLSQARRAAGFAPIPFAFAGGLALVARRWYAVPAALVAGVVVQHFWPGDFEYGLRHGGPALATWFALFGGAAALVAVLILKPREPREHHVLGAAAAFCFVLPVLVHGALHWSLRTKSDPLALSPRLVHNLRTKVPKGAIVLAPVEVSYRVAAVAPVYIVAAPIVHVADTKANDPWARYRDVRHWVLTGDPRIARKYGATWQIRGGRLARVGGP